MVGAYRCVVVGAFAAWAVACGAGDNRVDPADLELRDLLGVAPETAVRWDADQRASARRVIAPAIGAPIEIAGEPPDDDRAVQAIAALDRERAARGEDPIGIARIGAAPRDATSATEVWLDERWDAQPAWGHLPGRDLDELAALAKQAGHLGGPVVVAPASRMAAIAVYVPPGRAPARLIVNPVLLASREAEGAASVEVGEAPASSGAIEHSAQHAPALAPPGTAASTGGNPYSFYGSVGECAAAQHTRCDSCLPASSCVPITDGANGNDECTRLGAEDGRGYFLECINLSLAITAVQTCVRDHASGCAFDRVAADSLASLESNAAFLTDPCSTALDACLADIYGAPGGTFPGLVDGGAPSSPLTPPRSTSVSCGDSCSSKSSGNDNCEASPSCDCSGPSCSNSTSCGGGCSSSNDQSGCGDNCDSCDSKSDTGGGNCGGESSSSSSGGCSGGSNGDSSCGSGGGCGGGSGGGCGGGSGGGCGGGSGGGCGGGSSSSGCGGGGGGGGGKCAVAKDDAGAGLAVVISFAWGLLPVPFAAVVRRRAKRRRRRTEDLGEQPIVDEEYAP